MSAAWKKSAAEPKPARVFNRIYTRIGERSGRRLYEDMVASKSLKPRMTPSRIAAYGMALTIHLVTLAIAAGGVWLIVAFWPSIGAIAIGAVAVLVASELRPRFGSAPLGVVDRERIPGLYALADRVSDELGTTHVVGIVISSKFNASMSRRGIRRRPYLQIGLPLFAILDPQERVGLLGHEIGHLANGDPARGVMVGTALETLVIWGHLLTPAPGPSVRYRRRTTAAGISSLASGLAAVFSKILAVIAGAVAWILINLFWHESQRAEYLADSMSGRVAGNRAAALWLKKLQYNELFEYAVSSGGIRSLSGQQMMDLYLEDVAAKPVDQWLASRSDAEPAFRLDATHPPLPNRIAFQEGRPRVATLTMTHGESEAIDRELAPFQPGIGEALVSNYRDRMYR